MLVNVNVNVPETKNIRLSGAFSGRFPGRPQDRHTFREGANLHRRLGTVYVVTECPTHEVPLDLSPLAGVHSPYESTPQSSLFLVYPPTLGAEYSAIVAEKGSA